MSRSINKVILIGHLGADPEIRFTSSGIAVCNVSLATNEQYANREGEQVNATEWHRLVFWRRLAEIAGEYLKKGSPVYIEGKMRYRTWTDGEEQERFTAEIEVRELSMLDGSRTDIEALNGPIEEVEEELAPF